MSSRLEWLSRLNTRLLLLILLTASPLLGILVHTNVERHVYATEQAESRALALARQIATRQSDMMMQSRALLEELARNGGVRLGIGTAACNTLLANLVAVLPHYVDLIVADRDGNVRCSASRLQQPVNVADRTYFRRVLETESFAVGDYQQSRMTGEDLIAFAQPVFNARGDIEAVVAAGLDPSWLHQLLADIELPAGVVAILIDSRGQIIARVPDPQGLTGRLLPGVSELLSTAALEGHATVDSVWLDGVTRITAIAPLFERSGGDLYVLVGLDKKIVFADISGAFYRDAGLLAAAVALVFLLGWIASQRLLVDRITDLATTAQHLGAGKLHARTTLPADHGELGQLARVLDETAAALETRQRHIIEVETELRRANRALRVLNATAIMQTQFRDEQDLLEHACRIMIEIGGYRMAWVGYAIDDAQKRIEPVARAGHEKDYLAFLNLSSATNARQASPPALALQTNQPCTIRNIAEDACFAPGHDLALERGYGSMISLPLRTADQVLGVLSIMAAEPNAFDDEEARLLEQAAGNLAFAIESLRAHKGRSEAEHALAKSEATLGRILAGIDNIVWSLDLTTGRLVYLNPAGQRIYARPVADFFEDNELWLRVIHPEDQQAVVDQLPALKQFERCSRTYRVVRPDGSVRWLDDRVHVRRDDTGEARWLDGVATDITEQRLLENSLRLRNRAIEVSRNGMLIVGLDEPPHIISTNPALLTVLATSGDTLIGKALSALLSYGLETGGWSKLTELIRLRREGRLSLALARNEDEARWFDVSVAMVAEEHGPARHAAIELHEVTDSRRYQAQIEHQANHDALTGLPNRNLLTDRLAQAISLARRHQRLVAVLFIDLDQFKIINDGIGHHVGDMVLREVGQRLATCLREGDTAARLGGDEFVIVCSDVMHEEEVAPIAARLLDALATPIDSDGETLCITASIGVALYPKDGEDGATLLKNADLAMYKAKDRGRANCQYFTPELDARISERVRLEGRLRQALQNNEFELFYQPQVNAVSGDISGLEALLRWRHPEHGIIAPGQFIHVAEETRLIVPIGNWVLREACRQSAQWHAKTGHEVTISVNVSMAQFQQEDFPTVVRTALAESGLPACLLELEITESMVMHNAERFIALLRGLKEIGVRIAIDDFGTGYSSLSYLKLLPVDRLKVDYSFVRDIIIDPGSAAICRAIISVAHNLQLGVVAEGVETESQALYLGRHHCDDLQGYHMSRPVPAGEITELLSAQRRLFTPPLELEAARTLLIVDDEANVLLSLRRLLRPDGYRILTAPNADEAFTLLASHEVSVIIADQRMSDMPGTEFLSRIKDMYPRTVRIVLSGFTDLQTVTESVNRGAVYKFLLKPWDNEELRADIREAFWHAELSHRFARSWEQ